MASPLRIVPLGGCGEIGKNMTAFEYGRNILLVDAGIMFPENDMLGIDFIIPDWQYLRDKKDLVRAIVVTHGHEDHTGALPYLLKDGFNAPIYATKLTRGLLEVKLKQHKVFEETNLNTIAAGETVTIGPFKMEFFRVAHSIPDGVGLGITTPAGLVVHTGDFKFDHTPVDGKPTDFARLAEFGGRGALGPGRSWMDRQRWRPDPRARRSAAQAFVLHDRHCSGAARACRLVQGTDAINRHPDLGGGHAVRRPGGETHARRIPAGPVCVARGPSGIHT